MPASNTSKTAYFQLSVWYNEADDKIHMAIPEVDGFVTTVNREPKSKRGHPNLFMKLARALKAAGAPHPDTSDLEKD